MGLEISFLCHGAFTIRALEGLLARVCAHVTTQISLAAEILQAHAALVPHVQKSHVPGTILQPPLRPAILQRKPQSQHHST